MARKAVRKAEPMGLMQCDVMLTEIHGARKEVRRQERRRGSVRRVSSNHCGMHAPTMRPRGLRHVLRRRKKIRCV